LSTRATVQNGGLVLDAVIECPDDKFMEKNRKTSYSLHGGWIK